MKKIYMLIGIGLIFLTLGYFLVGYISSYVGWYGYKKWTYRVATSNIEESKKRRVFVREVSHQIDSLADKIEHFKPYIEKGFRYGYNSAEETVPVNSSNFPYQLSFELKSREKVGLIIEKDQLLKFDSSGAVRGYLRNPRLGDTIVVTVIGEKLNSVSIKVWD